MAAKPNRYKCVFCFAPTGFTDGGKAFCIDCYVKLRESAHTHDGKDSLPIKPLPLTPYPTPKPVPFTPFNPNVTWMTVTPAPQKCQVIC